MKNTIQIVGLVLAFVIGITTSISGQNKKADKDTKNWIYEIEPVGVGAQGTYLIKVWSYSKKTIGGIGTSKEKCGAWHYF